MQLKLQVQTTVVVSGRTHPLECGVPLIAGEQQFRTRSSPRSPVEPTVECPLCSACIISSQECGSVMLLFAAAGGCQLIQQAATLYAPRPGEGP